MEIIVSMANFEMIRKGDKKVEVNIYDLQRQKLKVGDILTFVCLGRDKKIEVKITKISHYSSFNEMLLYEQKKDIGYPFKSFPEIISILQELHSVRMENEYGVVAIKFRKIKQEL